MKTLPLIIALLITATTHADSGEQTLVEYKAIVIGVQDISPPDIDPPMVFELEMVVHGSDVLSLDVEATGLNPYGIPNARDSVTFNLDTASFAGYCTSIPCNNSILVRYAWPATEDTIEGSIGFDQDLANLIWTQGARAAPGTIYRLEAKTFANVPEPSGLVLLGIASICLLALVRKEDRHEHTIGH